MGDKVRKENLTVRVDPGAVAKIKKSGLSLSEIVNAAIDEASQVKRCPTCGSLNKKPTSPGR